MLVEDIMSISSHFIPLNGNQQSLVYTPGADTSRNEIASGPLAMGDEFIVEDKMIEEKSGIRRLIFSSNLRAIQSEMGFRVTGGKKKKKVFDFNTLYFHIHKLRAASFLTCPPLSKQPSVLILGLGGGALPSFIHHNYPEATIQVVDIDAQVIKIAKEFFRLDSSIQTVEIDGLAFVEDAVGKSTYDYIMIDIDSKDSSSKTSFPPDGFLKVSFYEVIELFIIETILREGEEFAE